MNSGNFVLVLHTHLPWVLHHGNWPHGEDWLTEAAAECYLPLLNVINDLANSGIKPNITIDISPVLCEQLEHPDFSIIFENYCKSKMESAERDEKSFRDMGYDLHQVWLASYWKKWYEDRLNDFVHKYDRSIIKALKKLQDENLIEIMTCGATHGYLALLGTENSIELQIHAAVENYRKHFGRDPQGIWLPECAYRPSYDWHSLIPVNPYNIKHLRPGLEQFLAKYNIKYFITDEDLTSRSWEIGAYTDKTKEKMLKFSSKNFPHQKFGFNRSPLHLFHVSSSEKVEYGTSIAFTRHRDISMQVWSGEVGYPGEPDYLDFHKKQIGSYLRYWRVTDSKADMMYKTLYHPDWIWKKLDHQSNHFIHHIENTLNWHKNNTGQFGTLCTPFDTELFGHWWFEGTEFLRNVIKGFHESPYVNTITCSQQILKVNPLEIRGLPEGSWGENNNHDVWMNEDNKWTWEAIYNNENRFKELSHKFNNDKPADDLSRRLLTQALREMMLQHSSDWQFLIHTKSARDYAEQRFSNHHSDFNRLSDLYLKYRVTNSLDNHETAYLDETEKRNSCFPELQIEWWNR